MPDAVPTVIAVAGTSKTENEMVNTAAAKA
jgi:hypothetical protein